ncbi:pyroglutamyl-peptidase 1 isoform X1 [Dipodomys merriami]|uniref:pyroglutamyl-peptidase 1 isoform X1 n=1 Tax=Dipodomys merriami TaxID=94247 RepID=UPI003855A60E
MMPKAEEPRAPARGHCGVRPFRGAHCECQLDCRPGAGEAGPGGPCGPARVRDPSGVPDSAAAHPRAVGEAQSPAGGTRGRVGHGHRGHAGEVRAQQRLPGPGQLPLPAGLAVLRGGRAREHRLHHRHGRRVRARDHAGARRVRGHLEGRGQVPVRLHLLHLAVPEPRALRLRPRAAAGQALRRGPAGPGAAGHHRGDAGRAGARRRPGRLLPPALSPPHGPGRRTGHQGGRAPPGVHTTAPAPAPPDCAQKASRAHSAWGCA